MERGVPIWALLVTGLGSAGLAVLGSWLAAHLTAGAAERRAAAQRQHELDLAREDRRQDRQGETYVAMIRYAHWAAGYGHVLVERESFVTDPPRELPTAPSDGAEILARVLAYGSPDALSAFKAMTTCLEDVVGRVRFVRSKAAPPGQASMDAYEAMAKAQHELETAVDRLRNVARVELGGEPLPDSIRSALSPQDAGNPSETTATTEQ